MTDRRSRGDLHVVRRPPTGTPASPPPAVLFVHGAMDRATSFGRLAAHLPDVTVIAYDRRGYGRSTRPPSDDFDDQIADLVEVLDGQPVVALGHSFGGAVVLAAATRHPGLIRSAVIWEPPLPWMPAWRSGRVASATAVGDDPEAGAEAFMRAMIGDRIWDHLPATTRAKRRSEGPTLAADLRSLEQASWDPAEVRMPVIIGRGGRSRPHHQRGTAELARLVPGASLVTVDGADHGAHLSHAPTLAGLVRDAVGLADRGRRNGAPVGRSGPAGAESDGHGAEPGPGPAPHEEDRS